MKILKKDLWQYINPETNYYCYAVITTTDGQLELTSREDFIASGNSYTSTAGEGFPLGESFCKTIKLTIDNTDKKYNNYDFTGAIITLYTEIGETEYDENGNDITQYERILEGTYYITDTIDTRGDIVEITAYDAMIKFDKPFPPEYAQSVSANNIYIWYMFYQTCKIAGITKIEENTKNLFYDTTLGQTTTFGGKIITFIPENITCRQMLSYIAGMAGGNAIINIKGEIEIKQWDFYNEIPVVTGNNAVNIYDGTRVPPPTDIIISPNGTTYTENNIEYYKPETTTLNNALDDVDVNIDDIIITALKCKYHQTITGGTKEQTSTVGLSEDIGNGAMMRSDSYTYVAKLTGNGEQLEIQLTNENIIFDFDDSPPNPLSGQDAWYDEEYKINAANHLYFLSLTPEQGALFGNEPVLVKIISYYGLHKLYETTLTLNSIQDIASSNYTMISYLGTDIGIKTSPSGTGYEITNQLAILSLYPFTGYAFIYQPNCYAIEDYYTVDIEFLTDESGGVGLMSRVAERILGVPFRPFSGKFVPNPTVEIMDSVYIEYKDEVYFSFITDLNFTYLGESEFKNTAESKQSNESAYGTTLNNSQWEQIQYCYNYVQRQQSTQNARRSSAQTVLLPTAIDREGKITDYITCTLRDGGIWQS